MTNVVAVNDPYPPFDPMYRPSDKDLVSAGVVSALGAGIVTSFAVNQGQDLSTALMITAIASVCGMLCHQFDWF